MTCGVGHAAKAGGRANGKGQRFQGQASHWLVNSLSLKVNLASYYFVRELWEKLTTLAGSSVAKLIRFTSWSAHLQQVKETGDSYSKLSPEWRLSHCLYALFGQLFIDFFLTVGCI